MATIRFTLFTGSDGKIHVWPPVAFVEKPDWLRKGKVEFVNVSGVDLQFDDPYSVLTGTTPGQLEPLPAPANTPYDVRSSVTEGRAYPIRVSTVHAASQDTLLMAYVADNPEIIITG